MEDPTTGSADHFVRSLVIRGGRSSDRKCLRNGSAVGRQCGRALCQSGFNTCNVIVCLVVIGLVLATHGIGAVDVSCLGYVFAFSLAL